MNPRAVDLIPADPSEIERLAAWAIGLMAAPRVDANHPLVALRALGVIALEQGARAPAPVIDALLAATATPGDQTLRDEARYLLSWYADADREAALALLRHHHAQHDPGRAAEALRALTSWAHEPAVLEAARAAMDSAHVELVAAGAEVLTAAGAAGVRL
jgi:hypothetical protein